MDYLFHAFVIIATILIATFIVVRIFGIVHEITIVIALAVAFAIVQAIFVFGAMAINAATVLLRTTALGRIHTSTVTRRYIFGANASESKNPYGLQRGDCIERIRHTIRFTTKRGKTIQKTMTETRINGQGISPKADDEAVQFVGGFVRYPQKGETFYVQYTPFMSDIAIISKGKGDLARNLSQHKTPTEQEELQLRLDIAQYLVQNYPEHKRYAQILEQAKRDVELYPYPPALKQSEFWQELNKQTSSQ